MEVTKYTQDGVSYVCAGEAEDSASAARAAAETALSPSERLADDGERIDGCWTWTIVTVGSCLLAEAGEALYGPRWQSEVARDLEVSDRTVRRWVANEVKMPRGVYTDLLRLTQERSAALDALAGRLREMG